MTGIFESYSSGGKALIQMFRISGVNSSSSMNHNTTIAIQFILQGRGKYFINDRCYQFRSNNVLFSGPGQNQRCMPERGSYLGKICLRFPTSVIRDVLPISIHNTLPYVIIPSAKTAKWLKRMLPDLFGEIRDKPYRWYQVVVAQVVILMIVLYRAGQRRGELEPTYPELTQALRYIEKNFRTDINIHELSKSMGVTSTRMLWLFQTEVGMGIRHYIIQRRIAEAKLLLHSRHLEVRAISRLVGYEEVRLFLHVFTTLVGMTPEEYRSALFNAQADQGEAR